MYVVKILIKLLSRYLLQKHDTSLFSNDTGCCCCRGPDVAAAAAVACCCPNEYLKKSAPTDQKYGNEAGTPHGKKKISQKTSQEKLPRLRIMIAFLVLLHHDFIELRAV